MSWSQQLSNYLSSSNVNLDISSLDITKPLYLGVKDKLIPHSHNDNDLISAYFVGEVESTLGYHLGICRELKEQAFDLEDRFTNLIDNLALQGIVRDAQLEAISIQESYASKLISTRSNLNVTGASISADGDDVTATEFVTENGDVKKDLFDKTKLHEKKVLERLKLEGAGSGLIARYDEIRAQFLEEILKAYLYARTLDKGLRHVYSIDKELPEIQDDNYLPLLTAWYTEVSSLFNQKQAKIVPINWSLSSRSSSTGVPAIYTTEAEFTADRHAGEFTFNIKDENFAKIKQNYPNFVMRGITLHALTTAVNQVAGFKATLQMLEGDDELADFSPVIFNNIPRLDGTSEFIFEGHDSVFNRLATGKWHLEVTPKDLDGEVLNDDEQLKDLIISFQFAAWS